MTDKTRMQAPKGTTTANIEGHTYEIPKSGIITVAQDSHLETLRRHGFTDALDEPQDAASSSRTARTRTSSLSSSKSAAAKPITTWG
jgi:hypothetical protein